MVDRLTTALNITQEEHVNALKSQQSQGADGPTDRYNIYHYTGCDWRTCDTGPVDHRDLLLTLSVAIRTS